MNEEALKTSEEKYKELIEETDDSVTTVDKNGKLLFANYICENIFDFSREELVGKSTFDFIHPEDQERTKSWFKNCMETHTDKATIENRQINKTIGKIFYILWSCNFKYNRSIDMEFYYCYEINMVSI